MASIEVITVRCDNCGAEHSVDGGGVTTVVVRDLSMRITASIDLCTLCAEPMRTLMAKGRLRREPAPAYARLDTGVPLAPAPAVPAPEQPPTSGTHPAPQDHDADALPAVDYVAQPSSSAPTSVMVDLDPALESWPDDDDGETRDEEDHDDAP